MKTKILLIIYLFVSNYSCSSPTSPGDQKNFLNNFSLGEKLKYILLLGENYRSDRDDDFYYTGDTLELTILEISENYVKISEQISPNSNMIINDENYYWGKKDSIYINYWIIRNDSLLLHSDNNYLKSHLMYNPELSLKDFNTSEVEFIGWKTTAPYIEGNDSFYITNYTLLGNFYEKLNIYINNGAMQVDGPGNTTVYSNIYGIVRTSIYSWWTGQGLGWDRL